MATFSHLDDIFEDSQPKYHTKFRCHYVEEVANFTWASPQPYLAFERSR